MRRVVAAVAFALASLGSVSAEQTVPVEPPHIVCEHYVQCGRIPGSTDRSGVPWAVTHKWTLLDDAPQAIQGTGWAH